LESFLVHTHGLPHITHTTHTATITPSLSRSLSLSHTHTHGAFSHNRTLAVSRTSGVTLSPAASHAAAARPPRAVSGRHPARGGGCGTVRWTPQDTRRGLDPALPLLTAFPRSSSHPRPARLPPGAQAPPGCSIALQPRPLRPRPHTSPATGSRQRVPRRDCARRGGRRRRLFRAPEDAGA
jgi:hypothetical protein